MAARSGKGVNDMLFWYNNTPNSNGVVPSQSLYTYKVRCPGIQPNNEPSCESLVRLLSENLVSIIASDNKCTLIAAGIATLIIGAQHASAIATIMWIPRR